MKEKLVQDTRGLDRIEEDARRAKTCEELSAVVANLCDTIRFREGQLIEAINRAAKIEDLTAAP